jgi:hypothetical protein
MDDYGGSPDGKLAGINGACCVCQACLYIFASELRVLGQYLVGGEAIGYRAHHGGYRNPGPCHAGRATHDPVID